jgi:drug/metabolite transporter (DMT)-like permease
MGYHVDSNDEHVDIRSWLASRTPLFLVLLSTVFFASQKLALKHLGELGIGNGLSYPTVFCQGLFNVIFSLIAMTYYGTLRESWVGPNWTVRGLLIMRNLCGFCGLSFGLLSVQRLPVGDATVLIMTSPTFASIAAYLVLKEQFGRLEAASTMLSLAGACLVVQPSFLFGGESGSPIGYVFGLVGGFSMGMGYVFIRWLGALHGTHWTIVNLWNGSCYVSSNLIFNLIFNWTDFFISMYCFLFLFLQVI